MHFTRGLCPPACGLVSPLRFCATATFDFLMLRLLMAVGVGAAVGWLASAVPKCESDYVFREVLTSS